MRGDHYIQKTGRWGLWYAAGSKGQVCLILVGTNSVEEQSSTCKHLEAMVAIFNTLSTSTHGPEGKVLPFPSVLHSKGQLGHFPHDLRVGSLACLAHVSKTHSLRTSHTLGASSASTFFNSRF